MSISRLNRVLVAGTQGDVAIPWDSRVTLLERLRAEGDADDIIRAFEAVGTTSPVKLSPEQKRRLLSTVKLWLVAAGASVPEGIYALRNMLQHESALGALD